MENSSTENLLGNAIRLYLGDYILKKIAEKKNDWFFGPYINRYLTIFCLQIIKLNYKVSEMKAADLLNSLVLYHQHLAKQIAHNHGFIETILESSLICLFGLEKKENHAVDACKAAIYCIKEIENFNNSIEDKYNIKNYAKIGIGISTGFVSLGNIGSQYKLKFSAIGNVVNYASILTKLNKKYNTSILISEETNNLVKNNLITIKENNYFHKKNIKHSVYKLCVNENIDKVK